MATKHIDTVLQHAGTAPFNPETGTAPVPLPPMRASTVRFENLAALEKALRNKAAGNDKFEDLLNDVLQNTDKIAQLSREVGGKSEE